MRKPVAPRGRYRAGTVALTALCIGALWHCAAYAVTTDPAAQWQEPVNAELPSTSLSLELPAETTPETWAASQNVSDYEVFPLDGGKMLVEVAMPANGWDVRRGQLCAGGNAAACEPVHCQEVQLDAQWGASAGGGPAVTARLIRSAPSLERILAGASGTPELCEGTGDAYAENAALLPDVDGKGRIDDASLPADSDCWNLAVESACGLVTTPLSSVVPSKEPHRLLAVLDATNASQAAAIGGAYGLTPLRTVELRASKETLALFTLDPSQDLGAVLGQLATDARVSAAQPDFHYRTLAHADPLAALSYGPERTGAARLHGKATGKGALVAVIDTGADVNHPELKGRVKGHKDFTGEGYAADLHGTAIAGIIAAQADNEEGSYGVAPGVDLLLLKACQPLEEGKLASRCWTSTLVEALDEAMAKDARVINMSLSGPPDPLVARYVTLAHQQNRVLVASAGNGGPAAKPSFPAALPEVLAVTATDARDREYREANEGAYIALAAPGVDILSPAPGGIYPALSGTSMASAHVAGIAAMLIELSPESPADAVRTALIGSGRDLGAPGPDPQFGAGLVDACAAARAATADAVQCEETGVAQ